MIDDEDFLIDENADVDADAEEEDLLADVATPAVEQWNWAGDEPLPEPEVPQPPDVGAELDAFLSPSPTVVTDGSANTAAAATDSLDSLFGPAPVIAGSSPRVEEILEAKVAQATVVLPPTPQAPPSPASAAATSTAVDPTSGRGVAVLVIDPIAGAADSPVEVALTRLGFAATVVETGGAARDELASERYPIAFLRVGGDASWARMLVGTSQQRWPNIKFVASTPAGAPALMQQLVEAGVADVMEEPLPVDAALLMHIQAVIPELLPVAEHTAQMMEEMKQLRARMTQAVGESEARAQQFAARAQDAEQRLQYLMNEGMRQNQELNQLRSEYAMMQERAEELESHVNHARAEMQHMRVRAAELEAAVRTRPSSGADQVVADLKTLFAALQPYGFAMDQALTFLTNLSNQLGQPAELQRHIKNLQLTRGIIKRLEGKLA